MVGEIGIGKSIARGFACAAANLTTVIQLTGGTLSKALAMHLGAVLPHISHSINLDDQCEDDVTGSRIEIAEGSSPVPEAPGLGYEVDEECLKRLAAIPNTKVPRNIGILHMPGGHKIHTIGTPSVSRLTGFPEGNIRGIRLEVWEEDGSDDFATLYSRLEKEGQVWSQ
jgi:hypothetical protein